VRPYFNWVKLRIRVHSLENSERFEKLIQNVEYRCPVLNLFRAADVPVDITWERLDP
jgi:organic hydroperoxide reductase OsmC/OhrA